MRPLALAVGDPAGVGPQIAREAAEAAASAGDSVALFGPPVCLGTLPRATRCAPMAPGEIVGIEAGSVTDAICARHAPSAEGGRAQLAALDAAAEAVAAGSARALITGPTSKESIVLGGTNFVGQTEHLARTFGLADDEVTMLFLGPRLKVALVTTHLAVREVPDAITGARVERSLRHLIEALSQLGMQTPRIEVAGLNPHAGEGGLFGREEIDTITPALRNADAHVRGPLPAEAVFRRAASGAIDGVVAMLHDQATIASKLLDWGHAVNTTWGLPFVRTSVDHGVAYDAARAKAASADGMRAAIAMAQRLTEKS